MLFTRALLLKRFNEQMAVLPPASECMFCSLSRFTDFVTHSLRLTCSTCSRLFYQHVIELNAFILTFVLPLLFSRAIKNSVFQCVSCWLGLTPQGLNVFNANTVLNTVRFIKHHFPTPFNSRKTYFTNFNGSKTWLICHDLWVITGIGGQIPLGG